MLIYKKRGGLIVISKLVTTQLMFKDAYEKHYAIGAFNINNMELIQGVVGSAANLRSAVILQASAFTQKYTDLGNIVAIAENEAALAGIPIALHMDHGSDLKTIKEFIAAGFTSVMIDGSHHEYEKNIDITKSVCDYAHAKGVVVEGELGTISGIEDDVNSLNTSYTDPEKVRDFVERTGVDSLAISIGTSHGAYKFKENQIPQLRFDILTEVSRLLPGFPIVLHGASSVEQDDVRTINAFGGDIKSAIGIPEDMLQKAASMAVCKINVDTDLRLAMTSAVRRFLAQEPSQIDYREYIGAGRNLIVERVAHKIQHVFNSADRF